MSSEGKDARDKLPWLERDHERIRSLVDAVTVTSRYTATQFVLHRLLEDLRSLSLWHFDRQHHALSIAGLTPSHCDEQAEVLGRLANAQSRLHSGKTLDKVELVEFLKRWSERHIAQCSRELCEAAATASYGTHWDLVHTGAIYPNKLRNSIPPDPQTSGTFIV